jgi:hypothetical protein
MYCKELKTRDIIKDENNNFIRIEPPSSLHIEDEDIPLTVTDYVKLKTRVDKSLSKGMILAH